MEENIIYGGDYKLNFPFNSFGSFILHSLKEGGEKQALVNGLTKISWTYSKVLMEVERVANAIHNSGIQQNDVIAIISENRNEIAAISLAAMSLNVITAPISVMYSKNELRHAINISRPKIIFVSSTSIKNVLELSQEFSFVKFFVSLDADLNPKFLNFENFIKNFKSSTFNLKSYVENLSTDIFYQGAAIFLTSGTTGLSKGCELTQGNYFHSTGQSDEILKTSSHLPNEISYLNIAPWYHVLGFNCVFQLILSKRFTIFYLPSFTPQLLLETMQNYKISVLFVPPPIVLLLAKHPLVEKFNLSNLRLIISGAAPLSYETEQQIIKRFKDVKIFQAYGMTEGLLVTINHKLEKPISGSVGKILPGNYAKVIDEQGKSLGPRKIGEFCFKGLLVMKGYYRDTAATENIIKNGWLHSGDLGYYDDDQNFFIVDRLKELIKYKGYQVAPAELEGLLLSNNKIKDCGVIGIPNDDAGELPFAFVVKQPNVELNEDEVKNFVKKNASNAKWLRGGVKFIEEIPKNPSGKILRRELRDLYKSMKSKL